jgi:hypothetical protein
MKADKALEAMRNNTQGPAAYAEKTWRGITVHMYDDDSVWLNTHAGEDETVDWVDLEEFYTDPLGNVVEPEIVAWADEVHAELRKRLKTEHLQVRLSATDKRQWKALAAKEDCSVADMVRRAMRLWIEHHAAE